MRSIKKRLSLCRLVLVTGAAAIAMPIAARVGSPSSAVVIERQAYLAQPTANDKGDTNVKGPSDDKAAVGRSVVLQDDYYDRRRRYWEDRVERRLDEEENGDDEDAKDSKDSKAKDDEDKADSNDKEDSEEDVIERRREYWRDRLDREW